MNYTLRGVHALDESGAFTDPVDVKVEHGVITAVGQLPIEGGPELDGHGLWLLPGIFDCHCHVGCFTDDMLAMAGMDVIRWTLECAANAHRVLELGVTGVRDVATGTPSMRDGFATSPLALPLMKVSGPLIGQSGGHGDGFVPSTGREGVNGWLIPEYPGQPPSIVDSPDEMRRAVRAQLRSGVDWIKLATTGGLLSTGLDHPRKAELTRAEVETAVFEAGRAGVPVAAHAYGGEGLDIAIESGVRSIEHGLYLTEAQAAEMARRNTWLVPTLAVFDELDELGREGRIPQSAIDRVAEIMPFTGQSVAIAKAAGVRIALGTDLVQQGRNLSELTLMRRAGLTPEEALLAGTAGGAELCGVTDRGRIAPGQVFDAILLDDDPGDLECFAAPGAVTGVFQAGRPAVAHPRFAHQDDRSAAGIDR